MTPLLLLDRGVPLASVGCDLKAPVRSWQAWPAPCSAP